jgi:hypothetical protein
MVALGSMPVSGPTPYFFGLPVVRVEEVDSVLEEIAVGALDVGPVLHRLGGDRLLVGLRGVGDDVQIRTQIRHLGDAVGDDTAVVECAQHGLVDRPAQRELVLVR